jgi:hypothetical protein
MFIPAYSKKGYMDDLPVLEGDWQDNVGFFFDGFVAVDEGFV